MKRERDPIESEMSNHMPQLRARSITLAKGHSEDLLQDTLMKIWIYRSSFTPGTSFISWSFKIMYNHFINYYVNTPRRRNRIYREPLAMSNFWDITYSHRDPKTPEEEAIFQELSPEVLSALNKLPESRKNSVVCVDLQETSYKEAAKQLNLKEGTLMSGLKRGRDVLKKELSEYAKSLPYISLESIESDKPRPVRKYA